MTIFQIQNDRLPFQFSLKPYPKQRKSLDLAISTSLNDRLKPTQPYPPEKSLDFSNPCDFFYKLRPTMPYPFSFYPISAPSSHLPKTKQEPMRKRKIVAKNRTKLLTSKVVEKMRLPPQCLHHFAFIQSPPPPMPLAQNKARTNV